MPTFAELLAGKNSNEKLKKIQKESKEISFDTYKVHMPDFVALDLETTGLDRKLDRITEIGMVKYIGGKEVDSYSILVNPEREIPPFIVQLTGITNEAVAEAPKFAEVKDDVLAFIGRLAICGHQVDFDFNFLNIELQKAGDPKIKNWQIDTLSTARTVLPAEEGYALGKVAKKLGIKLENAHRALDDARASGDIAIRLLPKLGELPPHTRKKLAEIAPFSLTKKILESSVRNYKPSSKSSKVNKEILKKVTKKDENFLLTDSAIDEMFSVTGPLSSVINGYSLREDQVKYAKDVAQSLNSSTIALLEGGTGTGKSLGYLLPAAKWAVERGERVIVSTNTKNLQDQLIANDLPSVKAVIGDKLRFVTLKGKNNYLCLKGWDSFIAGESTTLSVRERGAVMPLITWADSTKTGDIEEQNSFNRNYHKQIWNGISSEGKECNGCSHFEDCFMQNARKKAAAAHIVVVNHALFYTDILRESSLTGDGGAIIIDEAHRLEQRGHQMLRVELDTKRASTFIDIVQQAVTATVNISKKNSNDQLVESARELKKLIKKSRKYVASFYDEITKWLDNNRDVATLPYGNTISLTIDKKQFSSSSNLAGINITLKDFSEEIDRVRQIGVELLNGTVAGDELKIASDLISQFRADISYLTDASTEGDIFWVDGDVNGRWVKLVGTTLKIGEFLESFWKDFKKPIICTSATLTPKQDFKYFSKRVGMIDLEPISSIYKSPFLAENTFFTTAQFAPDPSDNQYFRFVADTIEKLREETGRNSLVLFTNNNFLTKVYDELISRDEGKKHHVFAQGISGNRAWIQQQMSDVKGAVLLGSGSFWEGVDIPGDACQTVIIPKLPFPVPTNPLSKALADEAAETGRNGFIDYSMPEALLTFKQGIGRLIRGETDRGALVILDNRITNKPYGKQFIKLIGSEINKPENNNELILGVSNFFADKE